jgi:hypothetical protein
VNIQRVFVDADVLFASCTRNWLFQMRVSAPQSFQLHSTEDVLAEAISTLRNNHPHWSGGQVAAIRATFLEVIDELQEDFSTDVTYEGADIGDLHVHAAAIASRADILLTKDHALLSQPNADSLPYEAYHPDDFFLLLHRSFPLEVRNAVMEQINFYVKKLGPSRTGLVEALIAAGCPKFAEEVRLHILDLAGEIPRKDRRRILRGERATVSVPERQTVPV